jgi:hypothetical protein
LKVTSLLDTNVVIRKCGGAQQAGSKLHFRSKLQFSSGNATQIAMLNGFAFELYFYRYG